MLAMVIQDQHLQQTLVIDGTSFYCLQHVLNHFVNLSHLHMFEEQISYRYIWHEYTHNVLPCKQKMQKGVRIGQLLKR